MTIAIPGLAVRGYDIQKAKTLLADAGYQDTDNDGVLETADGLPLAFDVWIPSALPYEVDVATIWAREAKKVGIQMNVSTMDGDTLWGKMSPAGDYDIALWRWGGYADPDYLLSVLTSANAVDGGWSDSGFTNEAYDTLYNQQRVAGTFDERRKIVWEMQEILYAEMPYLVFNYWGDIGAVNTATVDGAAGSYKRRWHGGQGFHTESEAQKINSAIAVSCRNCPNCLRRRYLS